SAAVHDGRAWSAKETRAATPIGGSSQLNRYQRYKLMYELAVFPTKDLLGAEFWLDEMQLVWLEKLRQETVEQQRRLRRELGALRPLGGGDPDLKMAVKWARQHPESELHKWLEWNDQAAAECLRVSLLELQRQGYPLEERDWTDAALAEEERVRQAAQAEDWA